MRFAPAAFVAAIIISVSTTAHAASIPTQAAQNLSGCTPITEQERAMLKEVGSDIPSNGQLCQKDRDLLYGKCAESPYAYLETKRANSGVDVAHLNADYACRLYKFLKASDAAGKRIVITSAYRSVEKQASLYANYLKNGGAPVAPPGRSRHNFGIAVDLTFDGTWPNKFNKSCQNQTWCIANLPSCKWAHDNASSYGLRYPMCYEPWHIEPGTGVRGLEQLPSDQEYWVSDDGSSYGGGPAASYRPITQPFSTPLSSVATTPTAAVTPAASAVQPQICTPTFSCTNGVMYYQTSSCTTQTYQVCAYGCSGNACATATSTASNVSGSLNSSFSTSSTSTTATNTNTNDNTNTNQGTEPQSISDLLSSIANPFSAAEIGTSTGLAFELNPETGEIVDLSAQARALVPTSSIAVITSVQPTDAQQTFTSSDLVNTPSPRSAQASGFQQILDGLRQALTWAVQYLKPFGGNVVNVHTLQAPQD